MNSLIPLVAGLGAAVIGAVVGALLGRRVSAGGIANAKKLADSLIADAQNSVENFRKEAEIEAKDAFLK
ncbi:MAG: Rnase Y domain-containing protein, partial [bacterium]